MDKNFRAVVHSYQRRNAKEDAQKYFQKADCETDIRGLTNKCWHSVLFKSILSVDQPQAIPFQCKEEKLNHADTNPGVPGHLTAHTLSSKSNKSLRGSINPSKEDEPIFAATVVASLLLQAPQSS